MEFKVDEKIVEPIIRDQIAAAVVSQLGDVEELVKTMVNLALEQKVGRDGKPSKYSSDNKHTFIEAVAGNAIREAATEAIQAVVNDQKKNIQAAIEAELKRAPKKTAAAIVSAFVEGACKPYKVQADFTFIGNTT